jgi:signal recognition particle subunit SRP54
MGGPNGLLSNMQKAQAQGGRRGPPGGNPMAGMPNMGGMQEMMSKMMGGGGMPDLGALSKMMGPNGMPDFGALANMMGGGGGGGLADMMNSMMGGMGGMGAAPPPPQAAKTKAKTQRVKRK